MRKILYENKYWINILSPTERDLQTLHHDYHFHELDLEDCLAQRQRPKIDEYDKYLFIVFNFPSIKMPTERVKSEQLSIFIGQNYLITLSSGNLHALNQLFDKCQHSLRLKRSLLAQSTGHLLYEVLSTLAETFYPITDQINIKLKGVENSIFDEQEVKDQLKDIMLLKKNIITLRSMILPQRSVMATLEHKHKRFLPEALTIYFDDIVDKIEKSWNILESQKEVIESLEDTHESVLSHNINNTMRTLTVFSVILLPLSVMTGLFGMNVKLPFSDAVSDDLHFWYTILAMAIIAFTMFGVFKWKKWL